MISYALMSFQTQYLLSRSGGPSSRTDGRGTHFGKALGGGGGRGTQIRFGLKLERGGGARVRCVPHPSDTPLIIVLCNYLAPGGGYEVLFSPGLSVCLSLCVCVSVCVCPANILVFYVSAIRRDIYLKFMQDIYRVVLNSLKKH